MQLKPVVSSVAFPLCPMEQPALEKFIMAKLRLPEEVKKEIKRFLPTIATPTARLIKRLRFESDERCPERTLVYGSDRWRTYLRQRMLKARWAPPPTRPTIIYKESVRSRECFGTMPFNKFTGEPDRIQGSLRVEVTEKPGAWLTWRHCTSLEEVQAWERRARELTPPSHRDASHHE